VATGIVGDILNIKIQLHPETVQKTSSVFSPLFVANIGLDVFFEGQEKDNYSTSIIGATLVQTPTNKLN
jgi:hypothetical protein